MTPNLEGTAIGETMGDAVPRAPRKVTAQTVVALGSGLDHVGVRATGRRCILEQLGRWFHDLPLVDEIAVLPPEPKKKRPAGVALRFGRGPGGAVGTIAVLEIYAEGAGFCLLKTAGMVKRWWGIEVTWPSQIFRWDPETGYPPMRELVEHVERARDPSWWGGVKRRWRAWRKRTVERFVFGRAQ